MQAGRLRFRLQGRKLQGEFNRVKMRRRVRPWLLIKSKDVLADPDWRLETLLAGGEAAVDERSPSTGKTAHPKKAASSRKPVVRPLKRRAPSAEGPAQPAKRFFQSGRLEGDAVVAVGRHKVALTHLDKVYWPAEGYTKGDLLKYYFEIADYILPYLKDRPLILKRYPNGIQGKSFFQHEVADAPAFVRTVSLEAEGVRTIHYAVCDNLATLLYLVNLGAIAQHPWHARVRDLDHPDWITFDLDPQDADFSTVCRVALAVRDVMADLGLKAYAKTSGSSGMHIYVPIAPAYDYERVVRFAEKAAATVVDLRPDMATLERSLRKRQASHVYVDCRQNARGKSMAAPYTVRERPEATVSAPITWDEVEQGVRLEDFTIKTLPKRLAKAGDLFRAVLGGRQRLGHALGKKRIA